MTRSRRRSQWLNDPQCGRVAVLNLPLSGALLEVLDDIAADQFETRESVVENLIREKAPKDRGHD